MRPYVAAGIFAMLLTFCMTISAANAALQPYVGGYFKGNKLATGRVIMGANFPILFPDIIPSGHYIGPVLSVAGGRPAVSGYLYQSFLAAKRDGSITWNPQIWYGTHTTMEWGVSIGAGRYDYIAWYGEIYGISDGVANFKLFYYTTYTDWRNKSPVIKTATAGINTYDTTFYVGNEVITFKGINYRFNYFQFGVEADIEIGQVDKWDIQTYENAYYDSATNQWKYLPGYSIEGSKSNVTYWYNATGWLYIIKVGGRDYTNVNKYLTSADVVRWRYTGTTIGNEVMLWSSSGVTTPYPYT